MLQQLKSALSKRLLRFPRVMVDGYYIANDVLIVTGWINRAALSEGDWEVSVATRKFPAQQIFYRRPDVADFLGLPDTQCLGFCLCARIGSSHSTPIMLTAGKKRVGLLDKKASSLSELLTFQAEVPNKFNRLLSDFGLQKLLAPDTRTGFDDGNKSVDPINQRLFGYVQPLNYKDESFYQTTLDVHIPFLDRVWHEKLNQRNTAEVIQFGEPCRDHDVSIIIPLYGRIDFLRYQLAEFSGDEAMKRAEIIYVLDDPRLIGSTQKAAKQVFAVFGLSFKLVISTLNLGFAGANNLGVEHANTNTLLLMNSDVIPRNSGWLDEAMAIKRNQPDCGILGATLLYEDETIQHIGMLSVIYKHISPDIWLNEHDYQGLLLNDVDVPELRHVSLTTGAFMLIDKALYKKVGGFDQSYFIGDFEDSDLCMKVLAEGYWIGVSTRVVLYHLERQSQNLAGQRSAKHTLTMINGVRHTARWGKQIAEDSRAKVRD